MANQELLKKFLCGDCTEVLKTIEDSSIDLIVTSPPYADQRDYGATDTKIAADGYVEWFRPKAAQIHRVLKDTGSFILNINDKVVDGFQHLFVFKLVIMLCDEMGFHLVRDYIWHNPATPPNVYSTGKYGRTKKSHEYCFWFSKGNSWTFNMDPIRTPYKKGIDRLESQEENILKKIAETTKVCWRGMLADRISNAINSLSVVISGLEKKKQNRYVADKFITEMKTACKDKRCPVCTQEVSGSPFYKQKREGIKSHLQTRFRRLGAYRSGGFYSERRWHYENCKTVGSRILWKRNIDKIVLTQEFRTANYYFDGYQ